MKKRLIICNTYYQLIVAMQLNETLWDKDEVDVVISDQSNGSYNVYTTLVELNIFNKVHWKENSAICRVGTNFYKTLKKMCYIAFGLNDSFITNNCYDELVYYNADVYTYGIYDKLKKNNANLVCSRYEEGILSYEDSEFLTKSRLNFSKKIRKSIQKSILDEDTKTFYCFYPEFYKGNLLQIAVPKITDYRIIGERLKKIFNVDDEKLKIREKYIFFTSVYDFEGGEPIGETELVQKIAEIVGKDNLIVKTHPRDVRDAFKQSGIRVYEHSEIPWEAIQLNNDFSSKVLLTVNSGSVIGANMMIEKKAPALFLYKCCNYKVNPAAIATSQMIDRFVSELKDVNVRSIESLEEFRTIIGKLN